MFTILSLPLAAQDCDIMVTGHVIDATDGAALPSAYVQVPGSDQGAVTDLEGRFRLTGLCAGDHYLSVSFLSYEDRGIHLHLHGDTTLDVTLEAATVTYEAVVIGAGADKPKPAETTTLGVEAITDGADRNLGNLLEGMAGVSTIRNGNAIAKPVVHGLYGNRLPILNNGILQRGQQWGNDHAPEIDPLVANRISVVKGAAALALPGGQLGSVVLVEPAPIGRDPHLHGRVNYNFSSNGRAHGLNAQLQRYHPKLAWRVNGTLRRGGDQRAADYFLTNTGRREANLAVQLERHFAERLFTEVYLSHFSTELGVLRGAHIGNISDLERAFRRDVPFFTGDNFSYDINAPRQVVNHQLAKFRARYYRRSGDEASLVLALQRNDREEYDVRRGGRTSQAALSLLQYGFSARGNYEHKIDTKTSLMAGIQFEATDNENQPGTGILPLIPDYESINGALFAVLERGDFDLALRYDYENRRVFAISNTIPRVVETFDNNFGNLSASAGYERALNEDLTLSAGASWAARNPGINERHSQGLHQGVAGIEEGRRGIGTERGLKTTLGLRGRPNKQLSLSALAYYQHFNGYIFLRPDNRNRVTIRGTFPVFTYDQADARIYGLDLTANYALAKRWNLLATYAFLRGDDLDGTADAETQPLVGMPANNLTATLRFRPTTDTELEAGGRYVFRQNHLNADQDFLAPPEGYLLLHLRASAEIPWGDRRLRANLRLDNLLDTAYRDYLNRQRYFADDLGFNATLGLNYGF